MTLFVVKVDGRVSTHATFHRASWAAAFNRLSYPHAKITLKRITLPELPKGA